MKQQNDFTNPKSHLIPKEWPKNLIYLTNPVSNIDRVKPIEFLRDEEISLLRTHFKIKKVQIGHPCHSTKLDKGFGLFCTKKIPKNTILGEYTGETFVKPQRKMSQMHTPYALKLDEDIIINARRAGNELRMINDYRGISKYFNVIFDGLKIRNVERGVVKSVRDIAVGEEILLDYGKEYWFQTNDDVSAINVALWCLQEMTDDQTLALESLIRLYKKGKQFHDSKIVQELHKYLNNPKISKKNRKLAMELLESLKNDFQ